MSTTPPPPPADAGAVLGPDGYPVCEFEYGGRAVWHLGEAGTDGLLIEGHGPAALAALDAHRRAGEAEPGSAMGWALDGCPTEVTPQQQWVVFSTTCGCSTAEHEQHADEWGDCNHHCTRPGLPPCTPPGSPWSVDWGVTSVPAGTFGALPVTEVLW